MKITVKTNALVECKECGFSRTLTANPMDMNIDRAMVGQAMAEFGHVHGVDRPDCSGLINIDKKAAIYLMEPMS